MLKSNFRVFNVKSLQKCFTREEVIFRVPFCFKKKKKKKEEEDWKSADRKTQIKVVDRTETEALDLPISLKAKRK